MHKQVLALLQQAYPWIIFEQGEVCVWSPMNKKITYTLPQYETSEHHAVYALVHEVAHAVLDHTHYHNDIQLLRLEAEAWHKAKSIAKDIDIDIPEHHIQDCLDTYRDWVHKRSLCPQCGVVSMQQATTTYRCFNCLTQWKVPNSPLCRVARTVITA